MAKQEGQPVDRHRERYEDLKRDIEAIKSEIGNLKDEISSREEELRKLQTIASGYDQWYNSNREEPAPGSVIPVKR